MKTRTKVFMQLAVLAVFDAVIPVPITAGVLVYVALNKPAWFRDLVEDVYRS